jgi:hypothetical protein
MKQAVAIAYSEKRAAARKPKKSAAVEHSSHSSEMASAYEKSVAHTRQDLNPAKKTRRIK